MVAMALPFYLGFSFPALTVWCAAEGGLWAWFPLAMLFGALPIIDLALGSPRPPDRHSKGGWSHRAVLWLWVPVHVAFAGWATARAAAGGQSPLEFAGRLLSVGAIAGAIGINFAHELIHRRSRLERLMGDALLALVTYPHFAIEHIYGHHRRVATREDPGTARFGESYWAFVLRAVPEGVRNAWRLKPARMRGYAMSTALVYALVFAVWGARGTLFFFAQGLVAALMLEAINYVEHYGLTRRETTPGRFERVRPRHSWDSGHRLSNWVLIHLPRHADHHCNASKPYPELELLPGSPRLPAGYGTMMVVALLPPLWRRVMDPRATAADRAV